MGVINPNRVLISNPHNNKITTMIDQYNKKKQQNEKKIAITEKKTSKWKKKELNQFFLYVKLTFITL